jgi:D-serine deaminase-like pyridoxal phosphate-dependent protein
MTDVHEVPEQRDISAKGSSLRSPYATIDGQKHGADVFSGDFLFPLVVLKDSALDHNMRTMRTYCEEHGVSLAPHGKTTMAPRLFVRQLEAGAWGITVATAAQVRTARLCGIPKVFLANELVDRSAIHWIARELERDPAWEFLCYVDSLAGVQLLTEELQAVGSRRPLNVLLELGILGGRTGCRDDAEAYEVARAVRSSAALRLLGVAGFEGSLSLGPEPDVAAPFREFLARLRRMGERLADDTLISPAAKSIIVSAGGSMYFDWVVSEVKDAWAGRLPLELILRSGCYLVHDSGLYERRSPFTNGRVLSGGLRPALELWAQVLSLPEPGMAIVGFGNRDASSDFDLPVVRFVRRGTVIVTFEGAVVTKLNDQHARVLLPEGHELRIGDALGFGISHPCTTLDKWRTVLIVDDEYRVRESIQTYF